MNAIRRKPEEEIVTLEETIFLEAPVPATDQMPGIDFMKEALGSRLNAVVDSLAQEDEDPKVQVIGSFIGEAAILIDSVTRLIGGIADRPGDLGKKGKHLRSKVAELERFISASATMKTVDAEVIASFIKEFQKQGNAIMNLIWNILDACYELEAEDQNYLITAQSYIDELNQKAVVLKKTNGAGVWEELRSPEINTLKIPKGLRICIVDDEKHILDDTASIIDEAGGIAHKAMNLSQLSALGGQHVDVILLDHSIGDQLKGYDVLHTIKMLFPDAIVIVHTSEAKRLLAEEENPYGDNPIVSKHDWVGINTVIKGKLKQVA